jgi:integrase
MSLYKRGKVYWSAIWVDGVRQMRSLETSNRRRAELLEQAFKDELHTKRFQLPHLKPEMTFGELYTRFLAEGEVKTYHIERSRQFLPFFSEMSIGQISKNDIARYRKHRHQEHLLKQKEETPKPLTETTLNRDIEVIRHLLFWAADEGFLPANPIARIRMVRERRQRRPVMPVAEEVRLLASCSDHLRPIVIAALDTGMRRGELLNQLWEHVDFDRRLISVTHSKTAEGEHRQIPLTSRVYEMLSAARQPSGPLFTYEGGPVRSLKTGWAGALRRAGLPHYRFHDLRHTFNSRLVEAGVIADVRKELMGHSHGGDVHSLYTHVELPTLRDAVARLEVWHSAKLSSLTICIPQGEPPHVRPTLPSTTRNRCRPSNALLRSIGGDQPQPDSVACRPHRADR